MMSSTDSLRRISRSKKSLNKNDPDRFQPPGLDFRGKLIGIEDVPEARGDKMCQVAMAKLKAAVRTIGDHKQRITVNVSIEGIKLIDDKSEEVIHRHIVQRISFIARDVSDARAFGYVYGCRDGRHQFYGIKTEKVAEGIVLSLRDLFQVVFDMKKREVEEAKKSQPDSLSLFGSQRMSSSDAADETSNASLHSNDLSHLENELDYLEQGLEQMNAFMPGSLSSSPGGNSWPTGGLWSSTVSSSSAFHDKCNTLPAGSAALYRSMLAASRSPLSARSASLRLQQLSNLTEGDSGSTTSVTTASSGAVLPTARARVKSTSSVQHPVVALHFAIPPPASVPSSRRSTSSLSSTPTTPGPTDPPLTPACPSGWARFDLSPLSEVTQDASAAGGQTKPAELQAENSSAVEPATNNSQAADFANFPPVSSFQEAVGTDHGTVAEGCMSNDKFSDSFLAASDSDVKQTDSVVASSSCELMSPSSDKDSVSLPSPEAPPPPLPANVVTTELPSEPPVPPPRPRARANSRVGRTAESPAKSESAHSSPVQQSVVSTSSVVESAASTPPTAVVSTSVVTDASVHITSTGSKPRVAVCSIPGRSSLPFPSDDAPPPPLPPRHIPVSTDTQRQQLMRGTSLPVVDKLRPTDDVPPPPPPRRSISKPAANTQPVDPFAPIPAAVSVPARQQTSVTSNCPVIQTTIAPLPRPRPQLRQTQTVAAEAVSDAVPTAPRSSSSSPWQAVNTPPIVEPISVDPFSNVDPFAGSVSPDDPFTEPSLDGMLSDLSHDFDTDTLSLTAFRTRAVTIDSASSDVYEDVSLAVSTSGRHRQTSSMSNASHCSNVGTESPRLATTGHKEIAGIGCLVDLNTTDPVDSGAWQPFSDKLNASFNSQASPGFALYQDLQDMWCGSVDWKTASGVSAQSSDATGSLFDSSVTGPALDDKDKLSSSGNTGLQVSEPAASVEGLLPTGAVTDKQTSQSSLTAVSAASSSSDQRSARGFDDIIRQSVRAMSEPPSVSPASTTSAAEQRNSSFDALFSQFSRQSTSSSPAGSVSASHVNSTASVLGGDELSVPPTANTKLHDVTSAGLITDTVQNSSQLPSSST